MSFNKIKSGYFTHNNKEILQGDIIDQGGTKDYFVIYIESDWWMINFEYGNMLLKFYFDDFDNFFNIKGNIFDNPELISNTF